MQQGVVDQAMVHGLFKAFTMPRAEVRGDIQLDAEIVHTRWIFQLFCGNAHPGTLLCQLVFAEIHGGIETGAGTERRQQKFRRRHPLVVTAVFRRLIAGDYVLARLNFELYSSQMFYENFHDVTSVVQLVGDSQLDLAFAGISASSMCCRSRTRARCKRDFIAESEIPRFSATSSPGRSCKS